MSIISISIITEDNAAIEDIHLLFNTLIIFKKEVSTTLTSDDNNSKAFFSGASPSILSLLAIVALPHPEYTSPLIIQYKGAPPKHGLAPLRLNTSQPPFQVNSSNGTSQKPELSPKVFKGGLLLNFTPHTPVLHASSSQECQSLNEPSS